MTGNTVNFYTNYRQERRSCFLRGLPDSELFLDQTKTAFVGKVQVRCRHHLSRRHRPQAGRQAGHGAGRQGREPGQLHLLLPEHGRSGRYLYAAKATGKDASTTVTIAGYEVDVKVNVSAAAGNALVLKDDGLYVPTPEEVDISGKADKVTGATTGNFAALDGEGNLTDSGKKPADFVGAEAGKRLMSDAEGEKLAGVSEGATKTAASSTNGNVNIDGKEVVVYTEPENVLHDEDVEDFSAEEIAALLADAD